MSHKNVLSGPLPTVANPYAFVIEENEVDAVKEKIHYYIEWIRLLWVGMFLLGGGVISLLLTLDSKLKAFLFVTGMILQVVFAVIIGIIHNRVTALIERLEKGQ